MANPISIKILKYYLKKNKDLARQETFNIHALIIRNRKALKEINDIESALKKLGDGKKVK